MQWERRFPPSFLPSQVPAELSLLPLPPLPLPAGVSWLCAVRQALWPSALYTLFHCSWTPRGRGCRCLCSQGDSSGEGSGSSPGHTATDRGPGFWARLSDANRLSAIFLFSCWVAKTELLSLNAEVETCRGNSTTVFLEGRRNHFLISSFLSPVTSLGLAELLSRPHTRRWRGDSSAGTHSGSHLEGQ